MRRSPRRPIALPAATLLLGRRAPTSQPSLTLAADLIAQVRGQQQTFRGQEAEHRGSGFRGCRGDAKEGGCFRLRYPEGDEAQARQVIYGVVFRRFSTL